MMVCTIQCLPLKSEEAQYWLWSKHLAWSYYSKPPLIAWVNYLSTMVFGDTVIGIRINPVLIGFILPIIHYVLAKRLFNNEKVAFWSSVVLFELPHFRLTKLYPPQIDMNHKQAVWDELGDNVTSVLKETNSERVFIFSDSYHISSILSFYVKGNPQTYCVNTGRRMNQFDIWPGIDQFENQNYNAIYVSKNPLPPAIINSAETIQLMKTQKRIYCDQKVGNDIRIYYLKNFKVIDETDPTQF